jgi:Regulator of chromosome condensation (RCC1) repeat
MSLGRRRALIALCVGLSSACALNWERPDQIEGGSPSEPVSPGDPGKAAGPQDDLGPSDDSAVVSGMAIEAGGVAMAASNAADAGGAEDAASNAAAHDAAPSSADAGVDAGCGAQSYWDGSRCVRDPCADLVCSANQYCYTDLGRGACRCVHSCEGRCVDVRRDRAHCGACGRVCAGSLECFDGACEQPVQQLILGSRQTCALRRGGTAGPRLSCWGENSWGLFRDSDVAPYRELPHDVQEVPAARLMVLSDYHRCVVLPDSDLVRCWGLCDVECGATGPTSQVVLNDTPAENVVGLAAVRQFKGGGATCMLSSSGEVRCMGWKQYLRDTVSHSQPVAIAIEGEALFFRDLQGGNDYFCGSVGRGDYLSRRVFCWGSNRWNQLGFPDAPAPDSQPSDARSIVYVQRVEGGDLTEVRKTSTGPTHSCAVTDGGGVHCWGDNTCGMLGGGDAHPRAGAVLVQGMYNAIDVAVGASHSCALRADGGVSCWGDGAFAGQGDRQGDLGDGHCFSTAQPVPNLKGVIELRAGNEHTCVRLDSGAVKCWGSNGRGQLGDGTTIHRAEPNLVPTLL